MLGSKFFSTELANGMTSKGSIFLSTNEEITGDAEKRVRV